MEKKILCTHTHSMKAHAELLHFLLYFSLSSLLSHAIRGRIVYVFGFPWLSFARFNVVFIRETKTCCNEMIVWLSVYAVWDWNCVCEHLSCVGDLANMSIICVNAPYAFLCRRVFFCLHRLINTAIAFVVQRQKEKITENKKNERKNHS